MSVRNGVTGVLQISWAGISMCADGGRNAGSVISLGIM